MLKKWIERSNREQGYAAGKAKAANELKELREQVAQLKAKETRHGGDRSRDRDRDRSRRDRSRDRSRDRRSRRDRDRARDRGSDRGSDRRLTPVPVTPPPRSDYKERMVAKSRRTYSSHKRLQARAKAIPGKTPCRFGTDCHVPRCVFVHENKGGEIPQFSVSLEGDRRKIRVEKRSRSHSPQLQELLVQNAD